MKKIREKLRSENGASILLALLFFLLCAMVGASVLMAAASNAGKSRSSREEQQKYLTLSSALQLVCDELTAAEYTGTYSYEQNTYTVDVPGIDKDGNPTVSTITHTEHIYKQANNTPNSGFQCGLSGVLPLAEELDQLFSTEFPEPYDVGETTHYIYTPQYNRTGSSSSKAHILTLTVDQNDKPGLNEPVKVTVELGIGAANKYMITLKAALESDPQYTMTAVLTNKGKPTLREETANGTHKSEPVTWTLSQITREEAK